MRYSSHVANGFLSLQGLQTGLASGSSGIGPFSVPFSAISEVVAIPANSSNVATLVPTSVVPVGVLLVASGTAAMTCSAGFISAQLSRINPSGYPTIWTFDPAAMPTNVYVTVSNTSGAFVTIQFF